MTTRYNITVTNRWFGIRCYDSTKLVGTTSTMPGSLKAAEDLLESIGLVPVRGSTNSYFDSLMGWTVECKPTPGHSIDDCWAEITEDFFA